MQRRERGSMFWLRVMSRISLVFGRRLSRILVYGIALYFLIMASDARKASRAYLLRCLNRPASWLEMYQHFLSFASTIHDRVYFLNNSAGLFDIRTSGTDTVKALHKSRQGLLLFGAHLGSFEVLHTLAREDSAGLKLSMAMYPENARLINNALKAINPNAEQDIIALGRAEAILTIHQRLEVGAMVGILADRAVGQGDYACIEFLGAPAYFPLGPFRMAAMLRQPVCFMTGLYRGGNRYDVIFEMLTDATSVGTAGHEEAARDLVEKYARTLERHCREAPFNWFNFYDFWKATGHGEN